MRSNESERGREGEINNQLAYDTLSQHITAKIRYRSTSIDEHFDGCLHR